jgi:predicted CopG family antitoxin
VDERTIKLTLPEEVYNRLKSLADAEQLSPADLVDTLVLMKQESQKKQNGVGQRQSALDVLAELPGKRLFRTADDVDRYLDEEDAAWSD